MVIYGIIIFEITHEYNIIGTYYNVHNTNEIRLN